MKSRKTVTLLFSIQILIFIAMNWGGNAIISRLNWPIWLDSVGTVLCAYFCGPFCGAAVGATYNLLLWILYGIPWYYAAISALVAVIVGIAAKRKKLDTLLDTLTTSAIVAGTVTVAAFPINLLLNGGSTGNQWGDAVMGFLGESGFPKWGGLLIGDLYVELLDKLVILVTMYLILKLIRFSGKMIRERKKQPGETAAETAARTGALMLAVMLGASVCLGGTVSGRADEEKGTGINYSDYVQTIFSTSNGLPCGEANDIAMTGDGILWVGTYAGLYRYNGREFRQMNNLDSVRNVNCLYVDEEGRLWIGTNDNGLSIMINEQIVNVIDMDRGLPSNSVKSIIKSTDGYYYIGTTAGMQVLTLNTGLKRECILSEVGYADHLAADGEGNVAAVSNDGTLFLIRQGQVVLSRHLTEGSDDFRSCAFLPDGSLLAATTGNEIYRFKTDGSTFKTVEVIRCQGLQNIKTLHRMDNGELFVCADNGIACIDIKGNYELINTNEFNNSIDNMLVDYQGNLWFTSSRLGLLRLAPSDFRDIYSVAGMENRVVNTIVFWNNLYYFGTDKGLDVVDARGREQITNALTERFAGTRIRCMFVDRDNHLWVCTYGKGLVEIAPDGTEYEYNQENGAFGNRARVVTQLEDGTILAAGDTGLSFIRDHAVENTIDRANGIINSMVLTITEMADGTILAGTDGDGIAIIENREVTRLMTRRDGLSSEVILRTVSDPKTGGVYIVASNGLCYMNSDRMIRRLDNFPYYNNYDIWMKGTDTLFVLSSAGIYVVDRNDLLSGKDDLAYDLLDTRRGLTGSLTANAWTWFSGDSSELYLPCDTGVFVLNTASFAAGTQVYRMNVSGIRAGDMLRRVERNVTTKIPRGSSRVEILPEIINYSIQDPYVGYKLEGLDTEWTIVPQNSLGSVVYNNIPTGDFVFHLAVFDNSQENILAERLYPLSKDKEMYDNSWFIFYILTIPMFTVFWITWLLVKRHELKVEAELAQANKLVEMGKQTVIAIARTVDAKDARTSEHSKRVALYSRLIAESCGLGKKECDEIEWSAQMHDIGKIAIPDNILNKDSRLTDEEYAKMKTHTTEGAKILSDFTLLDHVIEGAEFHHERYDGRGYPKGLAGEDIPMYARIIGVADAFDAMTANRVYRKQMDFSYVLGELEKGRGTQFDPQYVDKLLQLIHEGTIDLNKIYHVSKEDSERAEEAAKEGGQA